MELGTKCRQRNIVVGVKRVGYGGCGSLILMVVAGEVRQFCRLAPVSWTSQAVNQALGGLYGMALQYLMDPLSV